MHAAVLCRREIHGQSDEILRLYSSSPRGPDLATGDAGHTVLMVLTTYVKVASLVILSHLSLSLSLAEMCKNIQFKHLLGRNCTFAVSLSLYLTARACVIALGCGMCGAVPQMIIKARV